MWYTYIPNMRSGQNYLLWDIVFRRFSVFYPCWLQMTFDLHKKMIGFLYSCKLFFLRYHVYKVHTPTRTHTYTHTHTCHHECKGYDYHQNKKPCNWAYIAAYGSHKVFRYKINPSVLQWICVVMLGSIWSCMLLSHEAMQYLLIGCLEWFPGFLI